MIYLILDTNIWIYLANGLDPITSKHDDHLHFDLLKSLKELKDNGDISILINDLVINEWNRNKSHCQLKINSLKKKLQDPDEAFKSIVKYTTSNVEDLKKEYIAGIQLDLAKNEQHIIDVDKFLNNECIKIDISQAVKLKMFEMSVNNTAPFHNKKNNVADATILFSAAEYLDGRLYAQDSSAIFVSNNYSDFTDNKLKNKFHPDIITKLGTNDIKYERVLPSALNLSKEIMAQIEEFYRQELWLESISFNCRSQWCDDSEGFPVSSYLDKEIEVKKQSGLEFDSDQLNLFPDIPISQLLNKNARSGECVLCGTLHIECPNCDTLICIEDPEEKIVCDDCDSEFELGNDDELPYLLELDEQDEEDQAQ